MFAIIVCITISVLPSSTPATAASLEAVLAGEHRSAENTARDIYRHPAATLEFFGIKPDMTVVEILPGQGWYTEVLAPFLKDRGRLIAASYGADHPMEFLRNYHHGYMAKLDENPELYGRVERVVLQTNPFLREVADATVDMVLDFRNTHNFIRWDDITEEAFRAYYRVLKPGGVLGIVEHRANPGSNPVETANQGYVPETYTIALAESIGFKLAAKSEINANPKDTKDHPGGVWTLLPRLRTGDEDPAKYRAIGESDRMTLKFVK